MASQKFDIVFGPSEALRVAERGIEAIDRTHAMLAFVRNTVGIKVDPVEMFDQPYGHEAPCGCEFYVRFRTETVGRFKAWRLGERSVAAADIACTPCQQHEQERIFWNGRFGAWRHDPRRKDAFSVA